MTLMIDAAYDAGLNYIRNNTTVLHILSQEPATFGEVATYTLGTKSSPSIAAPSDRAGGGRECVISAISDGSCSGTDQATHYALVSGTELLLANALDTPQDVTAGNPFTLSQVAFAFPDAVTT